MDRNSRWDWFDRDWFENGTVLWSLIAVIAVIVITITARYSSRRPGEPGFSRGEGERVDRQLDCTRHGPCAMTDVRLATHQHRTCAGRCVLQSCCHLPGVQRVNPGVRVEHGEESGRVVDPFSQFSALARMRAAEVLPTPRTPVNR